MHAHDFFSRVGPAFGLSTVEAPSAVLVVPLLGEAVVLQHLVGRMPEFGQGLGGAAVTS